ncbi:MAG: AmmeMemoRadiSam system protein B [Helicobacteraceae bacterium]|nr:AmmeMemoRadiSam system protein B [Candidatus Sulfurimonas ponti]
MTRQMSVAGTFYPARESELDRYFEHFNKLYDEQASLPNVKSKAVIVPHAGYVYSGYTASIAYRVLQNSNLKTFVVIGPSHRVAFEGVSLCDAQSYETPFGSLQSSGGLVEELRENFGLRTIVNAHAEHSTEVQFPFIIRYLGDVNIVELVYSSAEPAFLSEIIDFILQKEDCGVVISTDLSHFYTLEDANTLDKICLNAIKNLDTDQLHRGCEACGMIGVEAMLLSAKKLGLDCDILDYRTSADASDDTSRVVGYVSAYFTS